MKNKKDKIEIIYTNRRAKSDFEIIQTFQAGILLQGPEVKSLRAKAVNINSAFIKVENEEVFIYGMQISPYKFNTIKIIDPLRKRKLLLKKQEIKKISNYADKKGFTIIPLDIYFKNGWAKLTIAVAKGRKKFDKKEKIKEKDIARETQREIKKRNF